MKSAWALQGTSHKRLSEATTKKRIIKEGIMDTGGVTKTPREQLINEKWTKINKEGKDKGLRKWLSKKADYAGVRIGDQFEKIRITMGIKSQLKELESEL